MRYSLLALLLTLVSGLLSAAATATTTSWIVDGSYTNSDGAAGLPISGSFDLDDTTGGVSNLNIEVLDPTLLSTGTGLVNILASFTDGDIQYASPYSISLIGGYAAGGDFTGRRTFYMDFSAPLDSGVTSTTLNADPSSPSHSLYGECFDSTCNSMAVIGDAMNVAVYQGQVAPVPVPAAVWLFASAIGIFGVVSRRKGRLGASHGF